MDQIVKAVVLFAVVALDAEHFKKCDRVFRFRFVQRNRQTVIDERVTVFLQGLVRVTRLNLDVALEAVIRLNHLLELTYKCMHFVILIAQNTLQSPCRFSSLAHSKKPRLKCRSQTI